MCSEKKGTAIHYRFIVTVYYCYELRSHLGIKLQAVCPCCIFYFLPFSFFFLTENCFLHTCVFLLDPDRRKSKYISLTHPNNLWRRIHISSYASCCLIQKYFSYFSCRFTRTHSHIEKKMYSRYRLYHKRYLCQKCYIFTRRNTYIFLKVVHEPLVVKLVVDDVNVSERVPEGINGFFLKDERQRAGH